MEKQRALKALKSQVSHKPNFENNRYDEPSSLARAQVPAEELGNNLPHANEPQASPGCFKFQASGCVKEVLC